MSNPEQVFSHGQEVIYGKHGKCTISGIIEKTLNGKIIPFYKLESVKSNQSKFSSTSGTIWVPVLSAREQGLRVPTSGETSTALFAILESREFYFPLFENWNVSLAKLEKCLTSEGAIGLAKVYSFLFVLKKKSPSFSSDAGKFFDQVSRLLFKELSEATQETMVSLEEKAQKLMRLKLQNDN
jgi:RNA polymerase-interacting CarD/CdnL/TRCF family regulator